MNGNHDNEKVKNLPHNNLRVVEATLHKLDTYINIDDPVWEALDQLWDHIVNPEDNKTVYR